MAIIIGTALLAGAGLFYAFLYYVSRLPRVPRLASDLLCANLWLPLILLCIAFGTGAIITFARAHDSGMLLAGEIAIAAAIGVVAIALMVVLIRRSGTATLVADVVHVDPPSPQPASPGSMGRAA